MSLGEQTSQDTSPHKTLGAHTSAHTSLGAHTNAHRSLVKGFFLPWARTQYLLAVSGPSGAQVLVLEVKAV